MPMYNVPDRLPMMYTQYMFFFASWLGLGGYRGSSTVLAQNDRGMDLWM
jgi:hypothetical protein